MLVGAEMWSNGTCKAWLQHSDKHIQEVSKTVNGAMLNDLAKSVGYQDLQCVEMLRKGEIPCVLHDVQLLIFSIPRHPFVWKA